MGDETSDKDSEVGQSGEQESGAITDGSGEVSSEPQAGRGHPPMGCTFFILVGAFLFGIAIYGGYRFFQLNRDLHLHTEAEKIEIEVFEPSDQEKANLYERLNTFAEDVAAEKPATLSLSPLDMNHLFAVEPRLKECRGIYRVKEITDAVVVLEVSVGVRKFMDDDQYFNGYWHLRPVLEQGWVDTKLDKIETRKEEVDRDVWGELSSYPIMDHFTKSKQVVKCVASLDSIKCESGHVVVTYTGKKEAAE